MIVNGEYIGVTEAARLLGVTPRRIEQLCTCKVLQSAYKPGFGPRAHWRIAKAEIDRLLEKPTPLPA